MVLAGALWWLYFDSVAAVNLRVLELSGGSPTMARAIFAVGHMLPAFALLITASGVGLLLEDDPPRIAYGFACTGVALYMLGTRVIRMGSGRVAAPVRHERRRRPRALPPARPARAGAARRSAVVPGVGLEPTRPFGQPGLSRSRITRFRHPGL